MSFCCRTSGITLHAVVRLMCCRHNLQHTELLTNALNGNLAESMHFAGTWHSQPHKPLQFRLVGRFARASVSATVSVNMIYTFFFSLTDSVDWLPTSSSLWLVSQFGPVRSTVLVGSVGRPLCMPASVVSHLYDLSRMIAGCVKRMFVVPLLTPFQHILIICLQNA